MESLSRLKPYKARPPLETIKIIKDILKDLGIIINETNRSSENYDFHSTSIEMKINANLIADQIVTYGKGLTSLYALASSYAELIERIQNGLFFTKHIFFATKYFSNPKSLSTILKKKLNREKLLLDFIYAPDEKNVQLNELLKNNMNILKVLFPGKDKSSLHKLFKYEFGNSSFICVPFFHINSKSIQNLPLSLLHKATGTTGMCAGNTKEEALIQGTCEVFERFAVRTIYHKELSLPTIPLSYFRDTKIGKTINEIDENHKYSIQIKDCSLGMDLPVVGVLFIDRLNNKYVFGLGSDPSPITALERCMTEIFQGDLREKLNNFNLSKHNAFTSQSEKEVHYLRTVSSGSGKWPNSIFYDKANYKFNGFKNIVSKNDKEDLNYIIKLLFNLNFDIYIRDVSFLGFPSFYVYIPGMSELLFSDFDKILLWEGRMFQHIFTLFNLKNSDTARIKKLINTIEYSKIFNKQFQFNHRSWFCYHSPESDIAHLHHDLFLLMLWYRVGNVEKSFESINNYLDDNPLSNIPKDNKQDHLYYHCVRDYLKLKIDQYAAKRIRNILNPIYGKNLVAEVMKDFYSKNDIFKYWSFPSCFNCDQCEMRNDCRYFDVIKYCDLLQKKYSKNRINQMNLQNVFDD